MPRRAPRAEVESLLEAVGVSGPPVPVTRIARHLGAIVKEHPYAGELSGMLARDGDSWVIGVNSLEAPVRRRFTVAHEIGHLIYHPNKPLHVDRSFPVRFRDAKSSEGTDRDEIKANKFAAELLMPAKFLHDDFAKRDKEMDVDAVVDWLASRYRVSKQAMTIRLTGLGLLN